MLTEIKGNAFCGIGLMGVVAIVFVGSGFIMATSMS